MMAKSTAVTKAKDASVFLISSEQTLKASKALLSHMKKAAEVAAASSSKKNLLEEEEGASAAQKPILLSVTTKRNIRDTNKLKPSKIALPHPLLKLNGNGGTDPTTICLIVPDPQRLYKDIVASEEFPTELGGRITRVVDLKHLKAKFKVYEAQRKLFAEHDVFLADDRIINRLPKTLGKTFYKTTTKRPIPIVLEKKSSKAKKEEKKHKSKDGDDKKSKLRSASAIAKDIESAVGSALVHLSPSTQTSVKVGYAGWEAKKVAENAEAVARALIEKHIPEQWRNVRAVYLKGNETAALPIWQTDELWLDAEKDVLPEGSEELKRIEEKKALKAKQLEDKTNKRQGSREKPNVGKKRKTLEEAPASPENGEKQASGNAEDEEEEKPAVKKAKVSKKPVLPESNDNKLDKQIAERKAQLKKQKKAAKKAMDD